MPPPPAADSGAEAAVDSAAPDAAADGGALDVQSPDVAAADAATGSDASAADVVLPSPDASSDGGASRPAYTFEIFSTGNSCDDMTGGTELPAGDEVGTTTALMAMPFEFRFFGSLVTQYSVAGNGFLQLWASAGTPSAGAPERAMPATLDWRTSMFPNSGFPSPMVAPLAGNWANNTSGRRGLVQRVLGTSPNRRLVIQWSERLPIGAPLEDATFQARLNEGSNTIEFHYCMLGAYRGAAPARGGYQWVGVQSSTGAEAVQVSQVPMASVPAPFQQQGSWVRMTPTR